jgi:type IV pilus assembly protein PilB
MSEKRLRLGDMLVAAGMVSQAQVLEALARQKETGQRLGETLVALGYVSEAQMTQVVSNQLSIPWVNLYHVDFSRELLELVPSELAERFRLVPVYVRHVRRHGDTLYVAMDDPLNFEALQLIADTSGLPVKPMVASPTDIQNAIRVYYLGLPPIGEALEPEVVADEIEFEDVDIVESHSSAPPPEEEAEPDAPPPRQPSSKPAPAPALAGATPSQPPPPKVGGPRFLTLTLLDGTTVRLPSGKKKKKEEEKPAHGLTTRDLIHALEARAAGEDVSKVLPDDAWEPLFAALLAVLLRKGLVADWEFVDEWKKHRTKT